MTKVSAFTAKAGFVWVSQHFIWWVLPKQSVWKAMLHFVHISFTHSSRKWIKYVKQYFKSVEGLRSWSFQKCCIGSVSWSKKKKENHLLCHCYFVVFEDQLWREWYQKLTVKKWPQADSRLKDHFTQPAFFKMLCVRRKKKTILLQLKH